MAMKQCVKCGQLFTGEALKFCRFDGSPLVNKVAPPDEAATILFTTGQLNDLFPALEELRRTNNSGKLYE
jgi:hypothetical protein